MRNFLKIKRNKTSFYKLIILLAVICFLPLSGSDCENGIIGSGITGDIVGTWQLTTMSGYLQDICTGEVVRYDSNGTATLKCPDSNPIVRNYTVSNSILSYTETGVQYNITNLSNTTLTLEGRNIGRTLSYTRLPADNVNKNNENTLKTGKNSSE